MVAGQISRGQNFVAPEIHLSVKVPDEFGSETDFTWITSPSAGDLWITGIRNVTDLDRFRMLHIFGNP
jgi:predicted Zn-dependent protease